MSDRKIQFKIVTPERVVYDSTVDEVIVPTKEGNISVLARHVGLVSLASSGELRIKNNGEETILHIYKGILEVKKGSRVILLADSADHIGELDEEKIKEAKARVEKILAEKDNLSEVEFAKFEDILLRELARLKILEKHR